MVAKRLERHNNVILLVYIKPHYGGWGTVWGREVGEMGAGMHVAVGVGLRIKMTCSLTLSDYA